MKRFILFLVLVMQFSLCVEAKYEFKLFEKIAVFPIADIAGGQADEAWWQMREILTHEQRFFVASRRLMMNREVFLPKRELKPSDAIILGKILDAQVLVTSFLKNRQLEMRVFETENGSLLWSGSLALHSVVSVEEQILKVSVDMVQKWLLEIPFHSFVKLDDYIGKVVFERPDGNLGSKIYLGKNERINVDDLVQVVQIESSNSPAFTSEGMQITVIAEAKVVEVTGDLAEIEFLRIKDISSIKEKMLVRIPKEIERSAKIQQSDGTVANLSEEYLAQDLKSVEDVQKKHSSTASALHWIMNIGAFILLAF